MKWVTTEYQGDIDGYKRFTFYLFEKRQIFRLNWKPRYKFIISIKW